MKSLYLLWLIIFSDIVYSYKPDYAVKKQSKSIFSNKRYTETITPARYNAGNGNIKYERSATDDFTPKHYFPEVEYPANIMEASKPYYFRMAENSPLLSHFTDDVKTNFQSFSKPAPVQKVNPKIVPESRPLNIHRVTKTDKREIVNSTVSEPSLTVQENNLRKDAPNEITLLPIPQDKITTDNESIVMSEKMISPESLESIEYVEYETDCSHNCSFENSTSEVYFYDEIELIDDLIVVGDSIESSNSTIPLSVATANSIPSNSTSEDNARPNTETSVDPDNLPTEDNKTSVISKAPTRVGVGPLQNIKRRKLMQQIYNIPSVIS